MLPKNKLVNNLYVKKNREILQMRQFMPNMGQFLDILHLL